MRYHLHSRQHAHRCSVFVLGRRKLLASFATRSTFPYMSIYQRIFEDRQVIICASLSSPYLYIQGPTAP